MEIKLWDESNIPYYTDGADTPNTMTFYPVVTWHPAPCVVIFAGGAYMDRAAHEAYPIAEFFVSRGIHAAVVDYRVAPNRHPAPIADAQRAVKILRYRAKELKIAHDKIVTLGSSAGGHLAASTLILPDFTADREGADEIDKMSALPNGAILCYPVISLEEEFGHEGTGRSLLGQQYDNLKAELSLQNRVDKKLPQVFLWHTSEDEAVNVKNSLVFGERLRDMEIPFEMHIFPHGPHGLAMAKTHRDVGKWADLAADWILTNI